MSIVAVHGPYTFGSKGIQEAGPVQAIASNPANGLIWDFRLDTTTTRPDQDFSWAFPTDGTPTPQTLADPTPVTYATGGSKTATLTVSNVSRTITNKALTNNVATLTTSATHGFKVGQSIVISGVDTTFNGTYRITGTPTGTTFTYAKEAANVTSAASGGTAASDPAQVPTAGSYPITITAVAGAAPQMSLMGEEGGEEEMATLSVPTETTEAYDPGAHTVAEVQQYVIENPDQLEAVYEAEYQGKARSTLITWLEAQFPYDPGQYTVTEVLDYAADNPSQLEDIIAAEQAGKARSTLLSQLESMRSA